MQRGVCRDPKLVQVVLAYGDLDGGPVGVPVVGHLQVEAVKQATQDRFGHLSEPDYTDR